MRTANGRGQGRTTHKGSPPHASAAHKAIAGRSAPIARHVMVRLLSMASQCRVMALESQPCRDSCIRASLSVVRYFIAGTALLLISCAHPQTAPPIDKSPWRKVWSDEFDGGAGTRIDGTRWVYDLGDGCAAGICGWGNQEKESYTDDVRNVSLDGDGHLAIVARVAAAGQRCYYGACRYTSAKIKTKGRMAAKPGRIEARIKLPSGQGLWPAFWTLGDSHPQTSWPQCGELDILENHGSNPRSTSAAIHGPNYSGQTPFAHSYQLPSGTFADDFHRFALEWDSSRVRFFVDDVMHYEVLRADVERRGAWVFDQSFYVILNLAVGGHFDGDPQSDAILPATMLVDWVRVYEKSP